MSTKEKVVVTGFQPSGRLHIGNYLGMFKQAVAMQKEKGLKRYYFIADYHSLTQKYEPKQKSREIMEMAIDALALGIDPKKSTLFIQSHVPHHTNLAWIFNTLTPVGELERMVSYKEKVSQGQIANAGLLTYPILMAADILIYDADFVPVGEDQIQHLELTRAIARKFNQRFGKTFKEPQALLTKTPRVMSLNDPSNKMSKSIPSGCLFIFDSEAETTKKIMAAQTDSHKTIGFDPKNRPAVSNLVLIFAAFRGVSEKEIVKEFKNVGYKEFKAALAKEINSSLKPLRTRKKELMKEKSKITKLLEQNAKKMDRVASKKIEAVKSKVGLI